MFACDWCGTPIDSYAAHFAQPAFAECRTVARQPRPQLAVLDGGATTDRSLAAQAARNKIRNQARRQLARTNRQDRLDALGRNSIRARDAHHEHRIRKLARPPG